MEQIMAEVTSFIAFPIKTLKFDHLCQNFVLHEKLDNCAPLLRATKDVTGVVTSVSLTANGTSGHIPFTVPTGTVVDISGIALSGTTTYGSDTTYYFATESSMVETLSEGPVSSSKKSVDGQLLGFEGQTFFTSWNVVLSLSGMLGQYILMSYSIFGYF
ncbi:unnamed protein product [Choristocarpus tenellus]